MKSIFQCRWLWWGLASWLVGGAVAHSGWELSPPGDTTRNWSATLAADVGYTDNVRTTERNPVSSFSESVAPQLRVNLPMERTTVGLRYSYALTHFDGSEYQHDEQNHTLDLLLTHTFNPRLVLNVSESLRRGILPELVQQVGGQPIITQRRGDYTFDAVHADLNYTLARRWTIAVNADWDVWQYDDKQYADPYDRNDYGAGISALYTVDARTVAGLNYRYLMLDYAHSGTGEERNWDSHTMYVSLSERLNPQLSAQLNGGGQLALFGDGSSMFAPWAGASVIYNYGPDSSVSGGFSHSLMATEVGLYRSSESSSVFVRLDHRVTTRLRVNAEAAYILSSIGNKTSDPAAALLPSSQDYDAWRLSLGMTYGFTTWLSATLNYIYDELNSNIAGYKYNRNTITAGLRLIY
jgi:hypothetical protein